MSIQTGSEEVTNGEGEGQQDKEKGEEEDEREEKERRKGERKVECCRDTRVLVSHEAHHLSTHTHARTHTHTHTLPAL